MTRLLIFSTLAVMVATIATANADVNQAVDKFFSSITADVNEPTIDQSQSAGIVSFGGVATRSQVINLNPMQFTPPDFSGSCGNINFYSGSMSFMTNTDQLVGFLQNTLMTAGITAVMTALKAVTPNVAGTLQSMFDASQKMLNMFNNSCQLGMALGNSADSWMYDRIAKAKSLAHSDSGDASDAEINSTVNGGSVHNLAKNMERVADVYHNWVNKNSTMNPQDGSAIATDMATKYGSVIWKGMQALHLYSLPMDTSPTDSESVKGIANLVISLTGDLIIYSPNNDGTGIQARVIPPTITDIRQFMTGNKTNTTTQVYNCSYFITDRPGECNNDQVDLTHLNYPTITFDGKVIKNIQTAMNNIQEHFVSEKPLSSEDLFIIAISPVPIFAIAQALDDIGMSSSITNSLSLYSEQIAFEILQKLVNVSLNLAIQAATARTNNDTVQQITNFTKSITELQNQINSYAYMYIKRDPVEIIQELNYLRSYAQNQMSPDIVQKVNFAKQLDNY